MDKAINLNIKGIKCDNPKCDFIDENAKVEEYSNWLNRPCPKCGANLLTEADYNNTRLIIESVRTINKAFLGVDLANQDEFTEKIIIRAKMNGTGNVEFEHGDLKE